jgi:hypothetical protein
MLTSIIAIADTDVSASGVGWGAVQLFWDAPSSERRIVPYRNPCTLTQLLSSALPLAVLAAKDTQPSSPFHSSLVPFCPPSLSASSHFATDRFDPLSLLMSTRHCMLARF